MKRIFTLLFAVVMTAMTAMATDYTDNLQVSVDGGSATTVENVKISVNKQDNGKYKFELKDFKFSVLSIGDVVLEDVEGTEKDGIITLNVSEKTIKVQNPGATGKTINLQGGIVFSMTAKISESANKMYADMTMKAMKQNIKAVYGEEKNIVTSIKSPHATKANKAATIYTLDGQQVTTMTSGNVYIVKTTDGQAKKVIKK